jgi:hypothetical protein
MKMDRWFTAGLVAAQLAGCSTVAGQWVNASNEAATQEDVRTCRSLSGSQAAAESRSRGGQSVFKPGAMDDLILDDARYAGEERQRQRLYGECMRRLGYRYVR